MSDEENGPSLISRAREIGLPLKRLADEAQLDKHTVYRLKKRSDRVEARTLKRVHHVVEQRERSLLITLFARHRDWLLAVDQERAA